MAESNEQTIPAPDPMGLTTRMNREYAEMLQKGEDPRVAAEKIKYRRLLAYVGTRD